ncbi:hypothetical protein [Cognaticolwellia mytili]|uniref:hypothetical protein n=1 Tax=Cognaticolwellia mytili TaxID=1888913 RepID=UPI000A1787F2|nr:hypothetical protein [Cognaticolwellia mytili]
MELHANKMQLSIRQSQQEIAIASKQTITNVESSEAKATGSLAEDKVTISSEGHEKNANDKNQAAFRKMMGHEEVENTKKSDGKADIDEKIAELKEKIDKLMEELSQLRGNSDEESEQKIKVLEMELASLNAQMLQLVEQKLESSKKK